MKKFTIILLLFLWIQPVFSQNINRMGFKMTLEKNWQDKPEYKDKVRVHATNKTAIFEIHPIGRASNDEATRASIKILQDNKVEMENFQLSTQEGKILGKHKVVLFEWTEQTDLDTITLYKWCAMYMLEIKDNKYVLFTSEFYKSGESMGAKPKVERMIASMK